MTTAQVTVHASNEAARAVVRGEIDLANAPEVEREIAAGLTNELTAVTVDLTETTFIDSAGIRVLFRLAERLQLLQISLELLVPSGSLVRRVVELSGLGQLVQLRPRAT